VKIRGVLRRTFVFSTRLSSSDPAPFSDAHLFKPCQNLPQLLRGPEEWKARVSLTGMDPSDFTYTKGGDTESETIEVRLRSKNRLKLG
jgi:hypothetical protein